MPIVPIDRVVRRVDIDHLNFPGHPFLFKKAIHDQEAVTGYQAVGPVMFVFVKLNGLPDRRVFLWHGNKRKLPAVPIPVSLSHHFDNAARVYPFMNMKGYRGHLKGGMFGLASPHQSRIKMRIKDQGEGFDVEQVQNPTQGDALLRSSGRGVYLLKTIMDTVEYKEGGRVVELEKANGNSNNSGNDKKS